MDKTLQQIFRANKGKTFIFDNTEIKKLLDYPGLVKDGTVYMLIALGRFEKRDGK